MLWMSIGKLWGNPCFESIYYLVYLHRPGAYRGPSRHNAPEFKYDVGVGS